MKRKWRERRWRRSSEESLCSNSPEKFFRKEQPEADVGQKEACSFYGRRFSCAQEGNDPACKAGSMQERG